MFYILNFDNHEFISCDNASTAEVKIRSLLDSGTAADSLEIINGFADECRFNVNEFRSYCETLDLVDEKTVHSLMKARSSDPVHMLDIKLEVGMGGTIKNDPDIKKDLRGKTFIITGLDEQSIYASCSIEGKSGTYAVAKYNMENVSMPVSTISKPSLKDQIQSASNRASESVSNLQSKMMEYEI